MGTTRDTRSATHPPVTAHAQEARRTPHAPKRPSGHRARPRGDATGVAVTGDDASPVATKVTSGLERATTQRVSTTPRLRDTRAPMCHDVRAYLRVRPHGHPHRRGRRVNDGSKPAVTLHREDPSEVSFAGEYVYYEEYVLTVTDFATREPSLPTPRGVLTAAERGPSQGSRPFTPGQRAEHEPHWGSEGPGPLTTEPSRSWPAHSACSPRPGCASRGHRCATTCARTNGYCPTSARTNADAG